MSRALMRRPRRWSVPARSANLRRRGNIPPAVVASARACRHSNQAVSARRALAALLCAAVGRFRGCPTSPPRVISWTLQLAQLLCIAAQLPCIALTEASPAPVAEDRMIRRLPPCGDSLPCMRGFSGELVMGDEPDVRPGEPAPAAGTYLLLNAAGTPEGRTATLGKAERLPTAAADSFWVYDGQAAPSRSGS
jgi:hypothetical protein